MKKYFIESWEFAKSAFKKDMLAIWGLILLQLMFSIPSLYLVKQYGFMELENPLKLFVVAMFIAYLILFFIMYKKVFNMASFGLDKPKLSNFKIIKALLVLGIFNCAPMLALVVCYGIAQLIPQSAIFLKIALNFFTYVFYLAMSLSIASIVFWNEDNSFIAILNSLKTFFKKSKYTMLLFFVIFILAVIIAYLVCTLLYAICIYFNLLDEVLVNVIHAIMNMYALYVISGLYIGAQVAIIKEEK